MKAECQKHSTYIEEINLIINMNLRKSSLKTTQATQLNLHLDSQTENGARPRSSIWGK